MTRKIRLVLGRIDFRLMLLLVIVIVLASFAVSRAGKTPVPTPTDTNQTAASWDDLLKQYVSCRDANYMLMVPPPYLGRAIVENSLKTYGIASFEQDPAWYWNMEGGLFLYTNKSPLAKSVTNGTQIVIYEDAANQEVLILDANSGKEEIVYKAPVWPNMGTKEDYADYVVRELSKRRVAWHATLKNATSAAQEITTQAQSFSMMSGGSGGGGPLGPAGASNELRIVWMQRQTNGLRIEVGYPASYSGTTWSAYSFDATRCLNWNGGGTNGGGNPPPPTNGCTNCVSGSCGNVTNGFLGLEGHFWTLVNSNLVLTGATQTAWIDTRTLGFDPATNPVNRVYGFGANAVDSDGDTLSDAREVFSTKTRADLWDTDGDGAGDGAEVIHGTNPLNNPGDADGDGLSDDLEIVLGTSPTNADTDLDWASDGYEVQLGFDPLSVTSAPGLYMKVNGGSLYTRSTNVIASFPGLVADKAIIAENLNLLTGATNTLIAAVPYGLQGASNGQRHIFARLLRGGWVLSPIMSEMVVLDTISPTIAITSPTNGTVTSRAWVPIQGTATDSATSVKMLVNYDLADGVSQGVFTYGKVKLHAGTNTILLEAMDAASNVALQAVSIVQDTTGDTSAPIVSLSLPRDYQITGGTTNWFNTATFGSNPTLYVSGTVNDDSAAVSFTVEAPGQTNGPLGGIVWSSQVWGVVTLFPGTNVLTATASDAAGNTYSTNYTVIRDTNFSFEISSPAAYEVANSPSVTVSGIASRQFSNATITVNGIGAAIANTGSNVEFTTVVQVPLAVDLTSLIATAELNGRSYYADPPIGYEIRDFKALTSWISLWYEPLSPPGSYWKYDRVDYGYAQWHASDRTYSETQISSYTSLLYDTKSGMSFSADTTVWTTNSNADHISPTAWFGVDSFREYAIDPDIGPFRWEADDSTGDGEIRFIKHWLTQETQTVVFQFLNMDYMRAADDPLVPSNIVYRGQKGFWYSNNVSFIVPIKTETEYTMSASDFDWPSYFACDRPYSDTWWYEKSKLIWFHGFTNHVLQTTLSYSNAANSPKVVAATNVLDDPCNYAYGVYAAIHTAEVKKIDSSLIIYHKDVTNAQGDVKAFDVTLQLDPPLSDVHWSVQSTPENSGTLINPDAATATFRNPTKGGRYRFQVSIPQGLTLTNQMWLPISGPDISSNFQNEINYLKDDWGPRYRTNMLARLAHEEPWFVWPGSDKYVQDQVNMMLDDLLSFGLDFDYVLRQGVQIDDFCGLAHELGPNSSAGDRERFTLKGASKWYVIDFAKRSNMGYAMCARAMGFYQFVITEGPDLYLKWVGNDVGTRDSAAAKKSYDAAIDIINGKSLAQAMDDYGLAMQEPDGRAKKEWPNTEVAQFPFIELLQTTKAKMEALTVPP